VFPSGKDLGENPKNAEFLLGRRVPAQAGVLPENIASISAGLGHHPMAHPF
jgi:hypothetical protein